MVARTTRRRVAAVILRDRRLLMVRQRGRGSSGRHDGVEYWTLPGGGIDDGESHEAALIREVHEETGLTCTNARHLCDVPYPSGLTACYVVDVPIDQTPQLGSDPDLSCDCPRLVGIAWIDLPIVESDGGDVAVPVMLMVAPSAMLR
jgi:8-oxo-dGTP diphosphatase